MKNIIKNLTQGILLFLILSSNLFAQDWPRIMTAANGTEITVYQPQVESFDKIILESRAAVMVKEPKVKEPIFGAVWVKAKVLTDRDTRLISLDDVEVTDAKFPDQDPAKIDALKKYLAAEIPKWELDITIDQLIASMESGDVNSKDNFKSDPPEIIYSKIPAVLISIDGDPVLKKLEGTNYEYVINTPFFIVKDNQNDINYLKGGVLWYKSKKIIDGWEWTRDIPADLLKYVKEKAKDEDFSVNPDTIKPKPEIIVRTKPAELLETAGEPEMSSVKGTSLLYIKNTESDVLFDINSQTYFILLSGRWFQAKSLNGPWSFIEPDNLPADFAKIPSESDLSNVLANVPGTQEAKDAILDTQIPQTAEVDRNTNLEVTYDGEPKFEPLSTADLYYATNTDKSVIKYFDKYYCCDNAVWFEASSPKGPWKVSVEVPDAIYKMNPDSPVYNTKYVYVYDYTPQVVYVGYYPGYTGCYVYRGTVIYGTGYYYRPWYGYYYYPRPVTYGFSMHYNPYTGWSFGFGMSVGGPRGWFSISYHPYPYYRGYWGPAGYHAGYRHGYYAGRRSGFYAGYKYAQNNNRPTLYGDGNRNIYNRENKGNITTRDRQITRDKVSTMDRNRNNVGTKNNVFTDKQGNVYKRENNQWQQRDGKNWSDVNKSKNKSSFERNKRDLNKQYNSRERGNQRTQNFNKQQSNPPRNTNKSGGRKK